MYMTKPDNLEPVPTAPGRAPLPPDVHEQITKLEVDIDKDRAAMHLGEPAPKAGRSADPFYGQPETDPLCKPAQTDACGTSCTLSASICRNAEKICTTAHDLPNDDWATQRCARANAICEAAHAQCCGCQG